MPVSAAMPYEKKRAVVNGSTMAYVDEGDGDPIVFLHGNPTSSYLWRNIMPAVADLGRIIAPDLIGMGDSDKLEPSGPDRYRYVEHREYLFALLDQIGVRDNVILVIHDWGSALGFDWAFQHQDKVQGIAFTEAIVRPIGWREFPEEAREMFQGLRSPAGEDLVLQQNLFIEGALPMSTLNGISDEAMDVYRRPFLESGEGRRPTLTWPREIPIDGEPADVHQIVSSYSEWLPTSSVPKLWIRADPGAIIRGDIAAFAEGFANQTIVDVPGVHFVQEDAPDEIGVALAAFVGGLRQT